MYKGLEKEQSVLVLLVGRSAIPASRFPQNSWFCFHATAAKIVG